MPNPHCHHKAKHNCSFILLMSFNTNINISDRVVRKEIVWFVCVCWVCVCVYVALACGLESGTPSHSNRCWSHGRPWQEVSAAFHQTHWSAHQPDGWMNDTNEKGALSSGQPAQDEWQGAGGRKDCLWTWKNSFSSLFSLLQGADSPQTLADPLFSLCWRFVSAG